MQSQFFLLLSCFLCIGIVRATKDDIKLVRQRIFEIKFIEKKPLGSKEERIAWYVDFFNKLSTEAKYEEIRYGLWNDRNTGRIKEGFFDFNEYDMQQVWSRLDLRAILTIATK